MTLGVVRSMRPVRRARTAQELEDFEQELVDQYALAAAGAGSADGTVAAERATLIEFVRFLGRPVWTAGPEDADRFLVHLRQHRRQARNTVRGKAATLARFYAFLIERYQGEIHAATDFVVLQPIDEFNRPSPPTHGAGPVPPSDQEVETLFSQWREALPETRKYLPAARDYLAASLWRRAGLRINESAMLDLRDWRPDLGSAGKLHVRFGKGNRGRGPKTRLVPAINGVDRLMEWWLAEVRHQFGGDWSDPDAPLLPSERRDASGRCGRIGTDALRSGFTSAVTMWLPDWDGRLTPHGMRHYCASSLYGRGVDLKAIQDLLGHEWLSTTTRYIHVRDDHIEHAWESANRRVAERLGGAGR
ncbi:tyrosine-type recombinase/integrase [Yinghuangia seranimata]|uniref:tyrosine-type recombinase/integrase n=1 Tax=Yinghuangia seranimata TaxID=408067 RepID=UPI00248AD770|nr:tyrosine-type recombinase/integrase [Yinghuangia seranimata]MDI2127138.1 tyrosine-type recombinase/integrase [Yinghuangia seranimata]